MDNYIQDYIQVITRATTISKKTLTGGRGSAVIVYHPNGSIREINISSSLVGKFYLKGERRDYCPLMLKVTVIDKTFTIPPTENMERGLFGESLLLGCTADGTAITDLPRHKKNGSKLTAQLNIEKQGRLFELYCKQYGMVVNSTGLYKNVQVRQKKAWKVNEYPDIDIWVYGTTDFISPFHGEGIDYEMACIDIKFTGSLKSTWGEFAWDDESIKYKDHFQLVLYHLIYELPQMYFVLDWSNDVLHKPVPVNVDVNSSDYGKATEAKNRIATVKETIRKFIIDLVSYEENGYEPRQGKECYTTCPNIYCSFYGQRSEV